MFWIALELHAAPQRALPDGYTRRVWQTQDGLPENTVQAFAQTPDNYLWIGTGGGLVRFDGAGFVVYSRDNTPAIRENSIFCLTTGRDGSLWAGTDGAGLLRYQHGVFRSYRTAQGLTNEFVRAVFESRDGVLWVGTDDGLFRLEGERLVRVDGAGRFRRWRCTPFAPTARAIYGWADPRCFPSTATTAANTISKGLAAPAG